jgi:hypothetical protein
MKKYHNKGKRLESIHSICMDGVFLPTICKAFAMPRHNHGRGYIIQRICIIIHSAGVMKGAPMLGDTPNL